MCRMAVPASAIVHGSRKFFVLCAEGERHRNHGRGQPRAQNRNISLARTAEDTVSQFLRFGSQSESQVMTAQPRALSAALTRLLVMCRELLSYHRHLMLQSVDFLCRCTGQISCSSLWWRSLRPEMHSGFPLERSFKHGGDIHEVTK